MTDKQDKLIRPAEVAARFRVDPKTVNRWLKAGLLPSVRTPGGRWMVYEAAVDAYFTKAAQ